VTDDRSSVDKPAALVARSVLFVPADRPDRYGKAFNSGADIVCVDLEDAVALENKAEARDAVAEFFTIAKRRHVRRALRINSLSTLDGLKDILHLSTQSIRPDVILLPKTSASNDIRSLSLLLAEIDLHCPIIAIIETAEGLDNASEIAMAPHVAAICFGSADYSAETGSGMDWDAWQYGRGRIVQAAARAGVLALDGAWLAIADPDGLAAESHRLPGIGFDGRVIIHPSQVAAVHQAFQPSGPDVERATKIMLATEQRGGSVITVDGRMVDRPVMMWAQRILARASHAVG
jgi:citrate lyase beta subunit